MSLHAPEKSRRPLIARIGPRRIALGAIAAMMATATVPTMSGCETAPAIIHAALTICPQLIAALLKLPTDTLPPGYEHCGDHPWTVRGATVKFCFYCSRNPSDPAYVQLGCSGPYYPLYAAPSAATTSSTPESTSPSSSASRSSSRSRRGRPTSTAGGCRRPS